MTATQRELSTGAPREPCCRASGACPARTERPAVPDAHARLAMTPSFEALRNAQHVSTAPAGPRPMRHGRGNRQHAVRPDRPGQTFRRPAAPGRHVHPAPTGTARAAAGGRGGRVEARGPCRTTTSLSPVERLEFCLQGRRGQRRGGDTARSLSPAADRSPRCRGASDSGCSSSSSCSWGGSSRPGRSGWLSFAQRPS
jgi:hypothetical protein